MNGVLHELGNAIEASPELIVEGPLAGFSRQLEGQHVAPVRLLLQALEEAAEVRQRALSIPGSKSAVGLLLQE
tara:strand:- start:3559 stop:3777 length:219 start_codon:yes stop_codon:yes gene_type:complete